MTYNQSFQFNIEGFSNISSNLSYFILTNDTQSFQLENSATGLVTFLPSTLSERIILGVMDEFGNTAIKQLFITYCFCSNEGVCDFTALEFETGSYFFKCIRSSHPEVFFKKSVLKICIKFTGEDPCRSAISIKLLCNFIEITLRQGCCPVNLLYIFRTLFLKNTCGWLLLIHPSKYLYALTQQ